MCQLSANWHTDFTLKADATTLSKKIKEQSEEIKEKIAASSRLYKKIFDISEHRFRLSVNGPLLLDISVPDRQPLRSGKYFSFKDLLFCFSLETQGSPPLPAHVNGPLPGHVTVTIMR